MRRFARDIAADSSGLLALLGVLLLLALGDSVLREEPLAELGYAIVLLSVFGAAVCSGHLVRTILESRLGLHDPYPLLPALARAVQGPGNGRECPVVVTLMLSSFSFLFAGLAGWVEGGPERV